jgi:hypothetical protein
MNSDISKLASPGQIANTNGFPVLNGEIIISGGGKHEMRSRL